MKPLRHVSAIVFVCAVTSSHGQGMLIAGHFGATDPTNEGFVLFRGGNPALGAVTNDSSLSAWSIGLNTSSDIAEYSRILTPQEQTALASGWVLSLNLRVAQPFGEPTVGIFSGLFPLVTFGAQPNGDPILRVGNSEFTLDGAGAGYHDYQFAYNAGANLISFQVDGLLQATDIAGPGNPPTQFSWGGGQHPPGSAFANWNEASLWAIPEPSALSLIFLAGGVLVSLAVRRLSVNKNESGK